MLLYPHLKIVGHSMEPEFKNNDSVIVVPYFLVNPKINDVVVFKKEKKLIVKRIAKIKENKFLTKGDNSHDSKDFGWISRDEVLGRVIFKL